MHNVHTWWHTNLSTGIHVMTTQQLTCRCNTPTESCLSRKLCLKGSKAKVQTCNTSRQHNNLVAITPVAQSRSLNYWVRLGRCYMLMIYLCGQNSCWQHCCCLLKCCLNSRCPSAVLLLLLLSHWQSLQTCQYSVSRAQSNHFQLWRSQHRSLGAICSFGCWGGLPYLQDRLPRWW